MSSIDNLLKSAEGSEDYLKRTPQSIEWSDYNAVLNGDYSSIKKDNEPYQLYGTIGKFDISASKGFGPKKHFHDIYVTGRTDGHYFATILQFPGCRIIYNVGLTNEQIEELVAIVTTNAENIIKAGDYEAGMLYDAIPLAPSFHGPFTVFKDFEKMVRLQVTKNFGSQTEPACIAKVQHASPYSLDNEWQFQISLPSGFLEFKRNVSDFNFGYYLCYIHEHKDELLEFSKSVQC